MSEEIGVGDFKTRIPSLSDDANIQQAFKMYHYGTTDGSTPTSGSTVAGIEGYLEDLQQQIDEIIAGANPVTELIDDTNLNNVITAGAYSRSTTPLAARNYPELSAGLLTVARTGASSPYVIYQVYQTIGGTSGTNNYHWRGRNAAEAWSDWAQASKTNHIHDDRYFTENEISLKLDMTGSVANRAAIVDSTGKVTSSPDISTTELGYLNNVTSNIQDQLNDRYTKSQSARIFVQSDAPTGAVSGNLWFW